MQNQVTITGTIKNVKTYTNERGTLLTGWLDQRDTSRFGNETADRTIYVVGMKIVALDNDTVSEILGETKAGTEMSRPITLTGRMVTKFSKDNKYPPMLQLEVHNVSAL
jgi:hypothetical protein